ncbi:hypothetical protein DXG01_006543 [Tephrocybe rancida]|nr:hypothetical protein DXG01_006543 [Tephrocybe rancida]
MSTPISANSPFPRLANSRTQSTSSSRTSTPKPPNRASNAILSGADHVIALFEEEKARIVAQHMEQLQNLEERFEECRNNAAKEKQQLVDRIAALEAELAVKSIDAMDGVETQKGDNDLTLDVDTTRLVRELAGIVKLAEAAPNQQGNFLDTCQLSGPFFPALAQYLASHNEVIQGLQEKQRATEKERDDLKHNLVSFKTSLLSQLQNVDDPGSARITSPTRMEVDEKFNQIPNARG